MIEVKDIYKSFDGVQVLKGVSATFETGKTNLIIGQSGSGKTVLMKSIVGLVRPEKGEILYDGRDLLQMNREQVQSLRTEIGMLFQGSALFDSETVLGNVEFPLMMYTRMSDAERRGRAQYLFCDEPNSGLDPKTSILIDELLSDITHEYQITTVINTHDMNSVLGIGENIVFINKGYREWVGNKELIYETTNEALSHFVFATDLFQKVKEYVIHNAHR